MARKAALSLPSIDVPTLLGYADKLIALVDQGVAKAKQLLSFLKLVFAGDKAKALRFAAKAGFSFDWQKLLKDIAIQILGKLLPILTNL